QLANSSGCCGVGTGLELALEVAIEGRSGRKRNAADVVDDLGVDVLGRTVHAETRTAIGDSLDLAAYTRSATLQSFFWRCHDARPLLLLASSADDLLARILVALALVGLGAAIFAEVSRDLTALLLVETRRDDFRRLRNSNSDASRHVVDHFVAEAERKLQVLALHGSAVTDAADFELLFKAVLHANKNVGDHSAGHAPLRTSFLRLVAWIHTY